MIPCASKVSAPLAVVLLAVVAGCTSTKPQEPARSTDGHRTIAEGYSLLYGITSQQKDLKKLLLVKSESDAVDTVINEIADYTGELSAQLEDMSKRYPALTVQTQFLPDVEVKARESITDETTKVFLATKGKDFERQLLIKQLTALEQERHIAKVMIGLETADERRSFWKRTEQRFGELYGKVEQLLERKYFC
jgi:septal ring factor EnvC (AmiA/AmiB activator)